MMSYIIMGIVLLHIVAGFAWFIWKLEIQGRKKEDDKNEEKTKNPPEQSSEGFE